MESSILGSVAVRESFSRVIAIDGPSGAGKSTIAHGVAQALSWSHIDSGLVYRAVASRCLDLGVDLNDAFGVVGVASTSSVGLNEGELVIYGDPIGQRLRDTEVGEAASVMAAHAAVRHVLTGVVRELARGSACVIDGRDVASHIVPEAPLKVYLDAAFEERARRRSVELTQDEDDVREAMTSRDHRDRTRAASPLKRARDAVVIDTTLMSISEVVSAVVAHAVERELSNLPDAAV